MTTGSRRRAPRKFQAWSALLALAITGCASSGPPEQPVRVALRFENLRDGAGHAEPALVREAVAKHATVVDDRAVRTRRAGPLRVEDREITADLPGLSALGKIQREIQALGQSRAGDATDLRLVAGSVIYSTNFVHADQELTIRGVTSPEAVVTLYADGEPAKVPVKADGSWSATLRRQGTRFVYGSSRDPGSGVERFFRVDVAEGTQQPISAEEFEKHLRGGA